jgi:hypothetical protein
MGARLLLACVIVMLDGMPALAQGTAAASWSWSATVFTYVIPDDENYAQPTFAADRDWMHVEARYNYEEQDTGSAWVGYNLDGEAGTLAWALTPMLGGAFGRATGVAPGYSGSLSWWKLDFYSEGEYFSDLSDPADSFFYNWSEISLRPVEGWRFGLVTQRTRARASARDIQRGPLVGVEFRNLELTAYLLDGGDSSPTFVTSIGFTFGPD